MLAWEKGRGIIADLPLAPRPCTLCSSSPLRTSQGGGGAASPVLPALCSVASPCALAAQVVAKVGFAAWSAPGALAPPSSSSKHGGRPGSWHDEVLTDGGGQLRHAHGWVAGCVNKRTALVLRASCIT